MLLVLSCSSLPLEDGGLRRESVHGVVVEVKGDLSAVESFTIRTEDGEELEFVPRPGTRFDGGPLSHLSQHLLSGEPVLVRYQAEGETLTAIEVSDA